MGSGRKPGPVLLPHPPTTQGPEGHSGVQPGHFSLAAPLPCETPLREEQALCTKATRISRLGARIKPSCSPQPTAYCWRSTSLWINTCPWMERFPAAPQNQVRLTCLPFSPQSSQWAPLPMMPTSGTHRVTREEKARGEGPGLRRHLLANAPPLCSRVVWQTSLINHRCPSR